jgi:hypothetical protein
VSILVDGRFPVIEGSGRIKVNTHMSEFTVVIAVVGRCCCCQLLQCAKLSERCRLDRSDSKRQGGRGPVWRLDQPVVRVATDRPKHRATLRTTSRGAWRRLMRGSGVTTIPLGRLMGRVAEERKSGNRYLSSARATPHLYLQNYPHPLKMYRHISSTPHPSCSR